MAVTINAGDRELHLTIRAASESTRDLIEGQMGALKSDLASSGYHLGGYSVDVSAGGQGGEAFSAFQQDPGRQPSGRESYARPEGRRDRPVQPAALEHRTRVLETRAGAINYRI